MTPWISLGQNTGVGGLSLLQGIFTTQGSNPGFPDCRWILYQLSHKGSPRRLNWVACPFSSGSSCPRNRTGVSCIAGEFFANWGMLFSHQVYNSFHPISSTPISLHPKVPLCPSPTPFCDNHRPIILWNVRGILDLLRLKERQKEWSVIDSAISTNPTAPLYPIPWHTVFSENSVQLSHSVVSDSLWPHGLQHTRLPCPSPTPGVYSNSCPLSQWCHPIISSSVIPFSSRLQSFPASGSFQMS